MRKTLLTIHRIVLIAGVLVALTPCGICPKVVAKSSTICSMGQMSGKMDCCHKAKSRSPFCQVMDQASVYVSPVQVTAPAVQAAPVVFAALPVLKTVFASSVISFNASPPQGLLSLRV